MAGNQVQYRVLEIAGHDLFRQNASTNSAIYVVLITMAKGVN